MVDATTTEGTATPAAKRKFVQGKVYLQDGNGTIWEYEALLSKKAGFTKVIPNPVKAKEEEKKETAK